MGLGTIIKIIIGITLYEFIGFLANGFIYYFFYSVKIVYSGVYLVFSVLGASSVSLGILYYILILGVIYLIYKLIFGFLSNKL